MTNAKAVIFKNRGCEVVAVRCRDTAYLRRYAKVYIRSQKGEVSVGIDVRKSDILKGKKELDDFMDAECDASTDDIEYIKQELLKILMEDGECIETSSEPTVREIQRAVFEYCCNIEVASNENKTEEPRTCYLKAGLVYINKTELENVLKEYGVKRLDILARLKVADLLMVGKGRCYDWRVKGKGKDKKVRSYYCIKKNEADKEDDYDEVESV